MKNSHIAIRLGRYMAVNSIWKSRVYLTPEGELR
jgi:hypothetical protein